MSRCPHQNVFALFPPQRFFFHSRTRSTVTSCGSFCRACPSGEGRLPWRPRTPSGCVMLCSCLQVALAHFDFQSPRCYSEPAGQGRPPKAFEHGAVSSCHPWHRRLQGHQRSVLVLACACVRACVRACMRVFVCWLCGGVCGSVLTTRRYARVRHETTLLGPAAGTRRHGWQFPPS